MIEPYKTMTPSHPEYPSRASDILRSGKLFGIGSLELLKRPAIGICGSRSASDRALHWARAFGLQAAKHSVVVVSGWARGIDREAHRAVLEAGGATIAVLPQGIRHFSVVKELSSLVDFGNNFLALSNFEPDAGWKAWRAMDRNKLIVALSSALFVIEASERGGTIDAAYECVRQRKKLYAVAYKNPLPSDAGNRKLLADTAIPLNHTGDLTRALNDAMAEPPLDMRQLALNLTGLQTDSDAQ